MTAGQLPQLDSHAPTSTPPTHTGTLEFDPSSVRFISVEPAFAPTSSTLSPDRWSTTQYRTSRIVRATHPPG